MLMKLCRVNIPLAPFIRGRAALGIPLPSHPEHCEGSEYTNKAIVIQTTEGRKNLEGIKLNPPS